MTSQKSEQGFLTGIAGKAFALAAVAAIALPLTGIAQGFGLPGAADSQTYVDLGYEVSEMLRPASVDDGIPTLQLVGEIQERFDFTNFTFPNRILDTHISFNEAVAGLAGAAVFGAAGSAFANASRPHASTPVESPRLIASSGPHPVPTGGALLPTIVAFDMLDGKPGPAMAGIGMAALGVVAAAAVGVPTYLTGKAVYDNFIRDNTVPAAPKMG
ncbi:MAG: hypothetical protein KKA05_02235 [Alphaproteobacteria bacterium]|nr:hypothetical protein [Alphaproteobacteria bacterium]